MMARTHRSQVGLIPSSVQVSGRLGRAGWPRLLSVLALILALAPLGCSRMHYRLNADRASEQVLRSEPVRAKWVADDFTVYPNELSRYKSPYDPDRPPLPPDDREAYNYLLRVDGKKGAKPWRKTPEGVVENPQWQSYMPTYVQYTKEGEIKLDLPTAMALARLHASSFQRNLEEIYLASLDVAFERFAFDVQFLGGTDHLQTYSGNEPTASLGRTNSNGGRTSQSLLDQRIDGAATKRLAAGAQLLVSFANSMVWQFSGDNVNFATTLLNFSMIQPILRGGGRAVILEQLTRAERALLYAVRAQVQFEQEFYKDVAVGGGTSVRPQRIGGFQGGAGLSGFTGTGQGGFGGVGAGQGFGGFGGGGGVGGSGAGGGAGLAGGGEGVVGGFYGLVQRLQALQTTEASLAAQINTLRLLEAFFEAGQIELFQIDEFRQNIATERSSLLRSQVAYQDQVENYLVNTLGLPPCLGVEVQDDLIRPFQLISRESTATQFQISDIQTNVGNLPLLPSAAEITPQAEALAAVLKRVADEGAATAADLTKFKGEQEKLLALYTEPGRRQQAEEAIAQIVEQLPKIRGEIDKYRERVAAILAPDSKVTPADARDTLASISNEAGAAQQAITLYQARLRLERVRLKPLDLQPETAFAIAAEHRLDWFNRRAALVDQWRLIGFNANRLQGFLNLQIDGNMGTEGDSLTRLRGPTGNLNVRLLFDAPLNRVGERNLYREALIDYDRARRGYITYVDSVHLQLRARIRQIKRLEENLEIQRLALEIAIRRVDRLLDELTRPLGPEESYSPTLVQNLLAALADFRNTQDNFLSVYLNHESAMMNLTFELGLTLFGPQGKYQREQLPLLPDGRLDWHSCFAAAAAKLEHPAVPDLLLAVAKEPIPKEVWEAAAPAGPLPELEPLTTESSAGTEAVELVEETASPTAVAAAEVGKAQADAPAAGASEKAEAAGADSAAAPTVDPAARGRFADWVTRVRSRRQAGQTLAEIAMETQVEPAAVFQLVSRSHPTEPALDEIPTNLEVFALPPAVE